MKRHVTIVAALALLSGGPVHALGLDRSAQDIGILFEDRNFAELSFGAIRPNAEGEDFYPIPNQTGNVLNDYSQIALGLKMDLTPQLSFALILDQPYGASVAYAGDPATSMLGGTTAELESSAITAIGRYRINDNFSVHAGLRAQRMEAEVTLSGLAYGGLNGYHVDLDGGEGTGWLIGAAYEIPDIALRVALTYFSEIENTFDATESMGGVTVAQGSTTVISPEAWNLDFQTGIAPDTLLMANVRHAAYAETIVSPDFFAGTGAGSITEIENGTSYAIGIGRRFNDRFSGSIMIGYEPTQGDDLVSPLSPHNGQYSLALGGSYTLDNIVLSGGLRYVVLGDAFAETGTPDEARAEFTGSSALALGLSIGYRF